MIAPAGILLYVQLLDAIQRVRALHYEDDRGNCLHCSYSQSQEYPCPTIKALDGETDV